MDSVVDTKRRNISIGTHLIANIIIYKQGILAKDIGVPDVREPSYTQLGGDVVLVAISEREIDQYSCYTHHNISRVSVLLNSQLDRVPDKDTFPEQDEILVVEHTSQGQSRPRVISGDQVRQWWKVQCHFVWEGCNNGGERVRLRS